MSMPRDIVLSACGTLSALGIGLEESAAAWQEGEPACFPATRVTPPAGADDLAGEVPAFALADLLATPKPTWTVRANCCWRRRPWRARRAG